MTSQLIYWLEYIVNFTGTIAYVFFLYLLIRRFLILRSERKLFILASFLMLTTLSGPIIYPEELDRNHFGSFPLSVVQYGHCKPRRSTRRHISS